MKNILAGRSVTECVSQVCRAEDNMIIREKHLSESLIYKTKCFFVDYIIKVLFVNFFKMESSK